MRDERESLQRQLEEAEAHLLLMEERKSQFPERTSIPLQLLREEELKKKELARLKLKLLRLSPDQSAARRALTEEEKQQIMLALLQSERLEDSDACKAVVEKLAFAADVDCDVSLHVRTISLLKVCLEHPNGLEELVEVLAFSYSDDGAAAALLGPLHETLQSLLRQPVAWAWVTQAKALLKTLRIEREKLEPCYLASCSEGVRPPTATTAGRLPLFPMLDSLAKMPCRTPDTAPLLEFLLRLLPHTGEAAGRLSAYLAGLAADLGFDLKIVREKVAREDAEAPADEVAPVYLMIKVTPSAWQPEKHEEPRRFLVKAWISYAGSFELLPEKDGEHTLETLPALIERFVAECHQYVLARSKGRLVAGYALTVEIFLPVELLDCEVDQWKIKVGKRTRPVGARYRMVVRSWDRVYDPDYWTTWDLWQRKWHMRPRPPLRATEESHVFIASCDADYCDTLYDHLVQRGTVFMALSAVPPARRAGGTAEIIWPMLDAGTPIALWLRREDEDVPSTRQELRDLVCGEDLNALPRLVHDRRREAQTEEERQRLWNDLTLLWDDPERLPPDIKFGRLETP